MCVFFGNFSFSCLCLLVFLPSHVCVYISLFPSHVCVFSIIFLLMCVFLDSFPSCVCVFICNMCTNCVRSKDNTNNIKYRYIDCV